MSTNKPRQKFLWIPLVLALGGAGLGFMGLSSSSIYRVYTVRQSETESLFKVDVLDRNIHEKVVPYSTPDRGHDRTQRGTDQQAFDFRTHSRAWVIGITIGLALILGVVGWLVSYVLSLVFPRAHE